MQLCRLSSLTVGIPRAGSQNPNDTYQQVFWPGTSGRRAQLSPPQLSAANCPDTDHARPSAQAVGCGREAPTAAGILKAAQEHDARLIVLGSSSRTDLPRIPLGSVSTRLLHMAARPVLIVPRGDTPTEAAPSPAAAAAASG